MTRRCALLVVLAACAHAPPRAFVLGKRVGLGEVRGDPAAKEALTDALHEAFELEAPNPELHLHVDATTSSFEEPVLAVQRMDGQLPGGPRVVRRVQTMRATVRLVEDATGEVRALGQYEVMEKGPERPVGSRETDDLAVILARRVVRSFIEQNRL